MGMEVDFDPHGCLVNIWRRFCWPQLKECYCPNARDASKCPTMPWPDPQNKELADIQMSVVPRVTHSSLDVHRWPVCSEFVVMFLPGPSSVPIYALLIASF